MNQRYPISFLKKNEYETSDFRFIDVCIDVMHTGANLNKTSFTKDVINKAVPTIANMPAVVGESKIMTKKATQTKCLQLSKRTCFRQQLTTL